MGIRGEGRALSGHSPCVCGQVGEHGGEVRHGVPLEFQAEVTGHLGDHVRELRLLHHVLGPGFFLMGVIRGPARHPPDPGRGWTKRRG